MTQIPLEDASHHTHGITFEPGRSRVFCFPGRNTSASVLVRNALATDSHLLISHARIDIDVSGSDEEWAVGRADEPAVNLPAQVEEDQQRPGKVELEKGGGVEVGASDRVQCDVELGDQGDDVDQDAQPRAPNTELGLVGKFVDGMAVVSPSRTLCQQGRSQDENWNSDFLVDLPGLAKANMSKCDGGVDKEDGETRQRQEPVEDGAAVGCQVDECQAAEEELDYDDRDRAALFIDVGQDLGSHAYE